MLLDGVQNLVSVLPELSIGKIALKLLDRLDAFVGVLDDLQVEHRLHVEDVGDLVGLFVLMLCQQGVELLEFVGQVLFGLLLGLELRLDFFDQSLELVGDSTFFHGEGARIWQQESGGGEQDK
ncbi:MAG: hypothetical protein DME25_17515 [Verrucomicrobia bacterium]|nr:MAG: hypothetical protein DME25_17515 [Verrucomicrobiota bacterium]